MRVTPAPRQHSFTPARELTSFGLSPQNVNAYVALRSASTTKVLQIFGLQSLETGETPRLFAPRFVAKWKLLGEKQMRPTNMLPVRNSLRQLARTAQFFARFAQSGAFEASQIRASMKRPLGPQSRQPGDLV